MAPPKSRKRDSSALVDDRSDNSDADDGVTAQRPTKKTRTTSRPGQTLKDANSDPYWELSGKRRVTVNKYNGKWFVGIREFYESGGKELPGKKGISLSIEQYSTLLQALPGIEKELKKHGEDVQRPLYDSGGQSDDGGGGKRRTKEGEDESEDEEDVKKLKKANYEATSDEDNAD